MVKAYQNYDVVCKRFIQRWSVIDEKIGKVVAVVISREAAEGVVRLFGAEQDSTETNK